MKIRIFCLCVFLGMLLVPLASFAALDTASGIDGKIEEMDKKIDDVLKALGEVQNNQRVMLEQLIAEQQKTRKWISNR